MPFSQWQLVAFKFVGKLSSTESEFYAFTCIDTIYLRNILAFLLDEAPDTQVHVDNSTPRQIAAKLGTSRVRHVPGKLLSVRSQVRSNVLRLKQVGAVWNLSDLGTKGLNRCRRNVLLYMFGFIDSTGEPVGEDQYVEQKRVELSKKSMKLIRQSSAEGINTQVARQVLRLTMLHVIGALGQVVSEMSPIQKALQSTCGSCALQLSQLWMVSAICWVVGQRSNQRSNNDPEVEPEPTTIPLTRTIPVPTPEYELVYT